MLNSKFYVYVKFRYEGGALYEYETEEAAQKGFNDWKKYEDCVGLLIISGTIIQEG